MKIKIDKQVKDFELQFIIKTAFNEYKFKNFKTFLLKSNELTDLKVDHQLKLRLKGVNIC